MHVVWCIQGQVIYTSLGHYAYMHDYAKMSLNCQDGCTLEHMNKIWYILYITQRVEDVLSGGKQGPVYPA